MGKNFSSKIKVIVRHTAVLYLGAAVILLAVGNLETARIRRMNRILEWGQYPIKTKLQGVASEHLGLRRALVYYENMAKAFPALGRGEELLGYCYFYLQDYSLAQKYYQLAKAKRPEFFWINYNLGVIAYLQNDQASAKDYFRAVIEADAGLQEKSAILNSLAALPGAARMKLLGLARIFVMQVRKESSRMLENMDKEKTENFTIDPKALRLQLHPWAYFIHPGQEEDKRVF